MAAVYDQMANEKAMKSTEKCDWKHAIMEELDSIEIKNACTQVKLPTGKDEILSNMVLKRTLDENGCVAWYTGRLGTKRYVQKDGVDYDETFAPDMPFGVLLLIIGNLVATGWCVHHADILTDFLSGDIDEDLIVEWDGVYYNLNKSLYGLKPSPCLWYDKLKKALEVVGSKQLESCKCVSKLKDYRFEVIVSVYVDDLLILSAGIEGIEWVKNEMKSLFKLTDFGKLR